MPKMRSDTPTTGDDVFEVSFSEITQPPATSPRPEPLTFSDGFESRTDGLYVRSDDNSMIKLVGPAKFFIQRHGGAALGKILRVEFIASTGQPRTTYFWYSNLKHSPHKCVERLRSRGLFVSSNRFDEELLMMLLADELVKGAPPAPGDS